MKVKKLKIIMSKKTAFVKKNTFPKPFVILLSPLAKALEKCYNYIINKNKNEKQNIISSEINGS